MGQYRFAIPNSERFATDSLIAAQIVGLDGIPYPCKTVQHENLLLLNRNTDLSGRLLLPYTTTTHGELAICTGTLPESETPYLLDVELARGCLNRLRNQVSIWDEGGLRINDDFHQRLSRIIGDFASVVFQKGDPKRIPACERVLDETVELMFEITDEFSAQIAALHNAQPKNIPVIAGSVFDGQVSATRRASQSAASVQRMTQPESLTGENGEAKFDLSQTTDVINWLNDPAAPTVRIVGPLLQFDNTALPDWMPEEGGFDARLDAAKQMCRKFGAEYQKRIKILHITSGLSGVGHQHFNYPQQLQMTLEMLETLDQVMPNTSMMVSFDQPWGERLSMATGGVQAMEIADSLLRYGARISAFGLEFNLDYWPHGTLMRDPLQWVDMIDRWSQFGLPLAAYLTAPTSANGKAKESITGRFAKTIRGSTESARHQQYLTTVFNFLVRRPAVNVVAWRRSMDNDNLRFPLSGLFDDQGDEKEAFDWFCDLVQNIKETQERSTEDTLPPY